MAGWQQGRRRMDEGNRKEEGAGSRLCAPVAQVEVAEGLLVKSATVLPHKELNDNIRKEQIVI